MKAWTDSVVDLFTGDADAAELGALINVKRRARDPTLTPNRQTRRDNSRLR
jgi:hypothetical protein